MGMIEAAKQYNHDIDVINSNDNGNDIDIDTKNDDNDNDNDIEQKYSGKQYEAQSNHTDSNLKYNASKIYSESNPMQLHIWDHMNAAWIPLKRALATKSKKKIITKSVMISKKFGGLDPAEILMYKSIENGCNELYDITVPHDLLMVILLYSQGYKFEEGDKCIFFPGGIFSDSQHGLIRDVLEDKFKKNSFKYLVKNVKGGGPVRVPFNHIFGDKIVIMDQESFRSNYVKYNKLKYGDVLQVNKMMVIEEEVYSKKKKRNIRKYKLYMVCQQLMDIDKDSVKQRRRFRKAIYSKVEVMWDSNIFLQAKWKRVDT